MARVPKIRRPPACALAGFGRTATLFHALPNPGGPLPRSPSLTIGMFRLRAIRRSSKIVVRRRTPALRLRGYTAAL